MRIEGYNAIDQLYKTNNVSSIKSLEATQTTGDKFEISLEAKSYQVAKSAVSETSDVRTDKVDLIKAQMAAGTYCVSNQAVADKILDQTDTLVF